MQCHLDAGLGTAALTGAYCPQLACHKRPPLRLQAVWCIGKLSYCSTAASCVPDIFGNADDPCGCSCGHGPCDAAAGFVLCKPQLCIPASLLLLAACRYVQMLRLTPHCHVGCARDTAACATAHLGHVVNDSATAFAGTLRCNVDAGDREQQ
jgi:hypothetical protein